MRVAVFDIHKFEREAFDRANREFGHDLHYFECGLTSGSVELARGFDAICSFVSDRLDAATLEALKKIGVRLIALRSAGFNHVDLTTAARLALPIVRVPEYSPYAVAEHAIALILTLNRKIHRAFARVRELNFSLEGLVGFDMHGKTVGVVGTGRIGKAFAKIARGFGCRVLAYDVQPDQELQNSYGVEYVSLAALYAESDMISLHVPLMPETRHMIDAVAIAKMKSGVLLINTGRGALIETRALIDALKKHKIGGAGLDVYEEEEGVFFHDLSTEGIDDDLLARLLTFPNVVITSHQAFLTNEALANIATITLNNISQFERGQKLENEVLIKKV